MLVDSLSHFTMDISIESFFKFVKGYLWYVWYVCLYLLEEIEKSLDLVSGYRS